MTNRLTVMTRYGAIEGNVVEDIARFRSIPYSGRIDGRARFAPPQPPQAWSGARSSSEWAPLAPQVPDGFHRAHVYQADYMFGRSYPQLMTEGGLYLNLWTPSIDSDAKRPVLVWLHGGGFRTGVPTRPREDPALICKRGDLVVVTPTHRLGAFGYAYLHRLLGTKDATANVGMLDIVASLVWVQENIRQFGGDPDNVTVMGESGGGMKVTTLLAMPRARGLFHRAVCIGGALAGGFLSSVSTIDQAAMLTERLVQAIGCRADELADLPMQILIDGQERSDARPVVWRPVIDGDILPGYPNEVIASGGGAPVPLLIGTAAHEADFLVQASPIFNVTEPAGLEPLVGERIHRIAAEYRAEDDGADDLEIARRILTDYFLRMPSIKIAESNAAHGNPTWMYLFDWTQPHEPYIRSTHGNETVFIFGNLQATGTGRGFESASGLSRLMQDAWIAFIRGGDPNHPNLPEWTRYSAKQRKTLRFADPLVILDDPRGRGRVAWD